MSNNKKDFLSGIFFFILGLFVAFKSLQYSIWSRLGPDAGFFPLLISIIIMGVSVLVVTRLPMQTLKDKGRKMSKMEKDDFFKGVSYGILMLIYALFIGSAGFLISTSLFLFIILKYVEKETWKTMVLFNLGVVLLAYLIFDYLLKVPLPKGPFEW